MIDRKALLTDLKKQVGTLEGDLRERAAEDEETHARLYGEWQKAREANRIAATYESWLDDRVTQAAVAWVLGTVFLRFCEDNGLIEMPFLAGPGEKLALAQERQADYIRQNPHDTDRDWILAGFKEMSRSPVAAGLFDKAHNPMWQIEIPHHAAKALLAFWRRRDEEGEIVHDFTDPDWDTRFLGDLYQDLSEHAKKTYALLQTPDFVEEFILDYTLEPAIDEFGLVGLRLIDPTCGSGHFLLGAFHRILNKWRDAEPGTDIWELIRRTLLSVHGVDKNPFATNIARFRLLVATMKVGKVSMLARAPEFAIIVASGDSLLHGRGGPGVQNDLFSEGASHTYVTEDIYEYISKDDGALSRSTDLLGAGSYHVVLGNPPYITVKDRQEGVNYKTAYKSCYREYSLSVPFLERFFQLCIRGGRKGTSAGYVGLITANSFMKREFGKKLIEDFLPTVDLSHIIDTSGAFIPGHGTPTVILVGRRRWPEISVPIRGVFGIKGEPGEPEIPSQGFVWRAIVDQISIRGSESEWISVVDVDRELFGKHPWTIGGGGASDLVARLSADRPTLSTKVSEIGLAVITGEDSAFVVEDNCATRRNTRISRAVEGADIRDWGVANYTWVINPYDENWKPDVADSLKNTIKLLWPLKTTLYARKRFSVSMRDHGALWYEWRELYASKLSNAIAINWAEVATHNHFSIIRGDVVAKHSSPVIRLKEDAAPEDYVWLTAILNSSLACFWLKQVCHDKGSQGVNEGFKSQAWERFYQFNGTKLKQFPLPSQESLPEAVELDTLSSELVPERVEKRIIEAALFGSSLAEIRDEHEKIRNRMRALQEELDWRVYSLYGLVDKELIATPKSVPQLKPGERAFELILARGLVEKKGGEEWFDRHGATPIVDIPKHWPQDYRRVVEKRLELIEDRRDLALIERPECKRRWSRESWDKQEKKALKSWLLRRCEEHSLWFALDDYGNNQPCVVTVNQLADRLRRDEEFMSVVRLHVDEDIELSAVVGELVQEEHVPYLAALRYKDPQGLRKRTQWEDVWEQQREEDRTGKQLDIPVPPKYTSADFLKTSYWRNRGKLDVPKERFISYPGSGPDGDSSMLLGWAGWDHREQAQALMMLIEERATQDGWDAARLTPLLAGLAELLPWVRQWHGELDPAFGQSPADAYAMYLEDKQREYGISDDDLRNWRPEKPRRGRRSKKNDD